MRGDLGRLLCLGGERSGEQGEGEDDCERSAYDHQAATALCWLSTAAIFRQPSILRNLICPLTTRLRRAQPHALRPTCCASAGPI